MGLQCIPSAQMATNIPGLTSFLSLPYGKLDVGVHITDHTFALYVLYTVQYIIAHFMKTLAFPTPLYLWWKPFTYMYICPIFPIRKVHMYKIGYHTWRQEDNSIEFWVDINEAARTMEMATDRDANR